MKKLTRNALVISVLFVLVVIMIQVIKPEIFQISTNRDSEVSLIQDRLVELSEWTTLEYAYSNVIVSRTEKNISILGITDIEYAEAIKLIEYSGYLKAGTDLSKIEVSYNKISKKLFVRVPKSKILDNVVETDQTKVEDIKGNIFSDYPIQLVFDEINTSKKQLEQEKVSQGFLEEADERTRLMLSSFLRTYGFDDFTIEFY